MAAGDVTVGVFQKERLARIGGWRAPCTKKTGTRRCFENVSDVGYGFGLSPHFRSYWILHKFHRSDHDTRVLLPSLWSLCAGAAAPVGVQGRAAPRQQLPGLGRAGRRGPQLIIAPVLLHRSCIGSYSDFPDVVKDKLDPCLCLVHRRRRRVPPTSARSGAACG